MPYELILKGYWLDELRFEEHHLFSSLKDLNRYASRQIEFMGDVIPCDRYDVRVKVSFDEEPLLAA